MADVEMPKSIPCQFDANGWRPCRKPSDNGWCSEHEGLKCVSCGEQATRSCDSQMGGLCCGASLCSGCEHDYEVGLHVTKEVATAKRRAKKEEEATKIASRTSSTRRMDEELGVPKNLFELLKGDWQGEGWKLKKCYSLELKHSLMGFFPAVFEADIDRIIVTTDLRLMERVWQLLDPREATLSEGIAYVNEELGFVYYETERPEGREDRESIKVLSVAEFEELTTKEEKPFRWAPGLLGGSRPNQKWFLESLVRQATKFDPAFSEFA